MKAEVITKDESLLLGLRLGGIDGNLIKDNKEILKTFNDYSKDKENALIIFSKSSYEIVKNEVEEFRKNNTRPLVVVID